MSPLVAVTVPNAAIHVVPSADNNVHVEATGWHSGPKPTLKVVAQGGTTTVQGGCGGTWLSRCSLEITVSAPQTVNGIITVKAELVHQ